MNKGYIGFAATKSTEFRVSPQGRSTKSQFYSKYHKIPGATFEERQFTSFAGILIFPMLFKRLGQKTN